jgi:hypothetical protein
LMIAMQCSSLLGGPACWRPAVSGSAPFAAASPAVQFCFEFD